MQRIQQALSAVRLRDRYQALPNAIREEIRQCNAMLCHAMPFHANVLETKNTTYAATVQVLYTAVLYCCTYYMYLYNMTLPQCTIGWTISLAKHLRLLSVLLLYIVL